MTTGSGQQIELPGREVSPIFPKSRVEHKIGQKARFCKQAGQSQQSNTLEASIKGAC
jgi:hypothetical protein